MKAHYTIITGASQGLGKAMAFELGKRRENLILISLANSGQEELSEFLMQNFHIDVHHLELDLSDIKSYNRIVDYINTNQLKIKYLINNAGVLSRGNFDSLSSDFILRQIEVNVVAPTILIRLLLDNLKRNSPSGILNVASLAGFFPLVKKQVYCGTKAYILSFSKALRKELEQFNIAVSTLCPGGLNTTTKLCYQNRIQSWFGRESILSPEEAAKIGLRGLFRDKEIIIPGLLNKCFFWIDKIIPKFIKDRLTAREIKILTAAD
jgi:short-subunit dehydrogenase